MTCIRGDTTQRLGTAMTDYTRYAVYYAPPEGSGLARFGAEWLGWDAASGTPIAHPDCNLDVATITAAPRKYGFHGTLTAPLRLADGADPGSLSHAIQELTKSIAPFQTAPLRLRKIGAFLALVPAEASQALNALHATCIRELIHFRAPASEAELAKRRANRLTPAQDALLLRWGYPFVLEEFRFHLTLSGKLDKETASGVEAVLQDLTAPFCAAPFEINEIALFGERASDGQFEIIRRYPLTG